VAQTDVLDARLRDDVDVRRAVDVHEVVLEATAFELERRHAWADTRSGLRAILDPPAALARAELPRPELRQLPLEQVRVEAEHVREVVGPDLHARLAHLEGGFRERMARLLDDEQPDVRILPTQLPGEGEAGESATGDDDVVARLHRCPTYRTGVRPTTATGVFFGFRSEE